MGRCWRNPCFWWLKLRFEELYSYSGLQSWGFFNAFKSTFVLGLFYLFFSCVSCRQNVGSHMLGSTTTALHLQHQAMVLGGNCPFLFCIPIECTLTWTFSVKILDLCCPVPTLGYRESNSLCTQAQKAKWIETMLAIWQQLPVVPSYPPLESLCLKLSSFFTGFFRQMQL